MKKLLLSLICLVGLVFAVPAATWTSTPTTAQEWDGVLSPSSATTTVAPTKWTAVSNNFSATWDLEYEWEKSSVYYSRGKNGVQLGSSSAGLSAMTLSTASFLGNISKVTIKGAKSNGNATISVKVGDNDLICSNSTTTLTGTATDMAFTGNANGKIVISISGNTSGKYIGFTGLTVEYTTVTKTPVELYWPNFDNGEISLSVGKNVLLNATSNHEDLLNFIDDITYTSENPDVAEVDENNYLI